MWSSTTRVRVGGEALRPLETVLAAYADTLRQAQDLQLQGDALADRATSTQLTEAATPASASRTAALEAADRTFTDAHALQAQAQQAHGAAHETAAAAVRAATETLERALPAPSGGPAPAPVSTGRVEGAGAAQAELGNAAASAGNTALRHPGDVAAVLGGSALAAVGSAGALGSLALDATGVGAVGGVPLGAASIGAVLAGAGIATAGVVGLAGHAATDSAVAPFRVDQAASPSRDRRPTRHPRRSPDGPDTGRSKPKAATATASATRPWRTQLRTRPRSRITGWRTTRTATKAKMRPCPLIGRARSSRPGPRDRKAGGGREHVGRTDNGREGPVPRDHRSR